MYICTHTDHNCQGRPHADVYYMGFGIGSRYPGKPCLAHAYSFTLKKDLFFWLKILLDFVLVSEFMAFNHKYISRNPRSPTAYIPWEACHNKATAKPPKADGPRTIPSGLQCNGFGCSLSTFALKALALPPNRNPYKATLQPLKATKNFRIEPNQHQMAMFKDPPSPPHPKP